MAERKRRPRTGEKRLVNQPLNIDRLPGEVQEAIQRLRNNPYKTWDEIEKLSALPYNPKWATEGGGFVNWEALDLKVLELFPHLKLPRANLQRWYDLRIVQVRDEVLKESAAAREWASVFAENTLSGSNAAVVNAMRDQVFNLMRRLGENDKAQFIKQLGNLTLAMTRMQRVELQAKRVEAELAKIEAERAKLAAEAGDPREIYLLAAQDLLKKLRTRKQVREVLDPIQDELIQELSHAAEAFAKQIEASAA